MRCAREANVSATTIRTIGALVFANLLAGFVLFGQMSQALANGSAIALCPAHGFHSFYQNMKTKSIAIAKATDDCRRIGIQKFQMKDKDARACCRTVVSISKGCVAIATGQGNKKQLYYKAYGSHRIPTVLKALKFCEKDYFDCQVKMTTCVGGR